MSSYGSYVKAIRKASTHLTEEPKVYFYLGYHSLVIILNYGITSMFLKRTHYTYFVSPSTLERFSKALVIVVQKPWRNKERHLY